MADRTSSTMALEMAAYVPRIVLGKLLRGVTPRPGQTEIVEGAVLFADLSSLASDSSGIGTAPCDAFLDPESPLAAALKVSIDEIRRFGGSVMDVAPEALIAYFPLPPTGLPMEHTRTLTTCALVIRDRLTRMGNGAPPPLKIGLARGDLMLMTVGMEDRWLRPVLCGTPIDMAVMAASVAGSGGIVADSSVVSAFGLHIKGRPLGNGRVLLEQIDQMALPRPKDEPEPPDWLSDTLRKYVPDPAIHALGKGEEFKPSQCGMTAMIVSLSGLDCDSPHAGSDLQRRIERISGAAERYGGTIYKIASAMGRCRIRILFDRSSGTREEAQENAIWCSLALRATAPPEEDQKIGLATGEVISGRIGTDTRREYVVLGKPLNRAMLLADMTRAGGITVDESIYIPGRRFIFEELGEQPAGDNEALRRAYSLVGVRAPARRLWPVRHKPIGPFLGRSDEVSVAGRLIEAALSGAGITLVITGAAGIGKSRLIEEISSLWENGGGRGFRGHVHPYGAHDPFCAWVGILEGVLGIAPDDTQDIRRDKLLLGVTNLCPEIPDAAALIAPLVNIAIEEPPALEILEPSVRKKRIFRVVLSMISALATERPTLLVIEDMDRADGLSWELASHLAGQMDELPALLCLELSTDGAEQFPWARQMHLEPLGPEESLQLMHRLLGDRQIPEYIEEVVTGGYIGSPLLMEEIARRILETGKSPRLKLDASTPPNEIVKKIIRSDLANLDGHLRELLNIASVIGLEVQFGLLRDVYPYPTEDDDLIDLLDNLCERGAMRSPAIYVDGNDERPESRIDRFRNRVIRETVYDVMPGARRAQIHLNVADILSTYGHPSPALTATHYDLGGDPEETAIYALLAGDRAYRLGAFDDAHHYYDIAERRLTDVKDRSRRELEIDLRLRRGRLYLETRAHDDAEREAQAALELASSAGDAASQVEALTLIAVLRLGRLPKEAIGVADRAAQIAEAEGHAKGLAEALRILGTAEHLIGHHQKAIGLLRRSLALARSADAIGQAYASLLTLADIYAFQRRLYDALAARRDALEMARESGDPLRIAETLIGVGDLYLWMGRGVDSIAAYREATSILSEEPDRVRLGRALGKMAAVLCFLGRYTRADVLLGEALDILEHEGDEYGVAICKMLRGREWAGDLWELEVAVDEITAALPVLRDFGRDDRLIEALLALADVHLRLGNSDAALSALEEIDKITPHPYRSWYCPEYQAVLSKKALMDEDFDDAHRYSLDALGAVGMGGDVRTLPLIYRLIAKSLIAQGSTDFDRIRDALERSLAAAKAQGRLYDLALSFYILGNYLKAWGDRDSIKARGAGHLFAADRLFRQMELEPPPGALRFILPE